MTAYLHGCECGAGSPQGGPAPTLLRFSLVVISPNRSPELLQVTGFFMPDWNAPLKSKRFQNLPRWYFRTQAPMGHWDSGCRVPSNQPEKGTSERFRGRYGATIRSGRLLWWLNVALFNNQIKQSRSALNCRDSNPAMYGVA